MAFQLRFAPHLGFPTIDNPLFDALVGSVNAIEHLRFAAGQGFSAFQDPFAATRSIGEQSRIGEAARELGLSTGCFVFAPLPVAKTPIWTATASDERVLLTRALEQALDIAARINSRDIAVLTGRRTEQPEAAQRHAFIENLAWAGDLVAARGCRLCIEAVNARRLPEMLLNHMIDAVDVVRCVAHPAVRLIFDFAHVQAMDGDLLYHLDLAWEFIEIIQIADNPGRVEPGAGELNFANLLDTLVGRGFAGLCELEHGWSRPGPVVQESYLSWLRRWYG